MDDLAEKLSELLNSPDGLDTVKSMASALLGGGTASATAQPEVPAPADTSSGLPFSPEQLQGLMKVSSVLKQESKNDSSAQLLLALRPHLAKERQTKVDTAVKMLKLIHIMPLLQDSGLFSMLL